MIDENEGGHELSLNLNSLQIWCYECDQFVKNDYFNENMLSSSEEEVRIMKADFENNACKDKTEDDDSDVEKVQIKFKKFHNFF